MTISIFEHRRRIAVNKLSGRSLLKKMKEIYIEECSFLKTLDDNYYYNIYGTTDRTDIMCHLLEKIRNK